MIGWAGYVARMWNMRSAYETFVGKFEEATSETEV
jgi:hypothetical protein